MTTHDESVALIGSEADASGTLLYPPDAVLSITNAAGDITFADGVDYVVEREARTIRRVHGSALPLVTPAMVAAPDGGITLHHLVSVTYTHADVRPPEGAPDAGGGRLQAALTLPRFSQRLVRHEPVTIAVTGDSISEGYDASGFHGIAPFHPAYPTLVASALERRTGAAVRLHNVATAGWTAADGLWDTARIVEAQPDLVIVAYGMNDACYASGDEYAGNIVELMRRVRDEAADVEFLLVAPMLATPACNWVDHARFAEYRSRLAQLAGDAVGFVDLTTLWTGLVARKGHYALSGNGLNHPNDYGHRIYADAILATLR